jgi:hypothetical protein
MNRFLRLMVVLIVPAVLTTLIAGFSYVGYQEWGHQRSVWESNIHLDRECWGATPDSLKSVNYGRGSNSFHDYNTAKLKCWMDPLSVNALFDNNGRWETNDKFEIPLFQGGLVAVVLWPLILLLALIRWIWKGGKG